MDYFNDTIQDFGRNMGLEGLALEEGRLLLELNQEWQLLFQEVEQERLIVSLRQALPDPSARIYKKALSLCDPRESKGARIHCGSTQGEDIYYWSSLTQDTCTLPELEQTVDRLIKCQSSLKKAF